jgi:hypothetical protein
MTHPTREARPPRPYAEYRRTDRKAHAFLDALAQHGISARQGDTLGEAK